MKIQQLGKAPRSATALLIAAALLVPTQALAQRAPGSSPGGAGASAGPVGDGGNADDLADTIEIYMIAKMKRVLSLSRDQEEKVVPLVQDLSEARRQHRRDRFQDMLRLRPLVEDPASSDDEIRKVLSHMEDGEKAFRSREASTLEQVRAALSARQQAQFILFQDHFRKEMQGRLRQLREGGAQNRPPRAPRGPGDAPVPDEE